MEKEHHVLYASTFVVRAMVVEQEDQRPEARQELLDADEPCVWRPAILLGQPAKASDMDEI
ncbi:hypothetical protein ACP4OV_028558 [Aristida adscensionis]